LPRAGESPSGSRGKRHFSDAFTYRLSVLVKLTDRATARAYFDKSGLSLSEARAMNIIGDEQPIGVQRLAGFGSLDKSQASRVADTLTARGLIEKVSDPKDGRATALSLTPRGRKVREALMQVARSRNEQILKPLTSSERRRLLKVMDSLVAEAEQDA
jgi:DNA-binding MarR family transcriptional regulator